MGITKTLWEILDHQRQEPAILDSRDAGTSNHFAKARPFRWKVGVRAALVLVAGFLVVVVGANFMRSLAPPPEALPVAERSESPSVEVLENTVMVHVVGAVALPGVVTVPETSRVQDALALAGGALEDADLRSVNLARTVFDGEQIVVPRMGDPLDSFGGGSGLLSLSQADQASLETLPRIGPATAERIIAWREANGPFRSVEDLLAISGIGPATLEGLADLVVP
ncbi:MAG: ComEA family DNA-binding protein [Pontimonas sp.]